LVSIDQIIANSKAIGKLVPHLERQIYNRFNTKFKHMILPAAAVDTLRADTVVEVDTVVAVVDIAAVDIEGIEGIVVEVAAAAAAEKTNLLVMLPILEPQVEAVVVASSIQEHC
jgi:hypothetical protein